MPAPGIGAEQRPVAEDIGQPGNPAAPVKEAAQGTGRKKGAPHSGNLQTVGQVGAQVAALQGAEMKPGRHPLCQLAQVIALQQGTQFRLPDQDDLEELAPIGFQVGQQPELFQDRCREILGLVDDHHRGQAAAMGLEQEPIQGVDISLGAGVPRWVVDPQFVTDGGQKFADLQSGVEDQGDLDILRQLLQQATADQGLAGADLPRQQDETSIATQGEEKMGHGLPVGRTQVEIVRIGGNGKWIILQAKMFAVHRLSGGNGESGARRSRFSYHESLKIDN